MANIEDSQPDAQKLLPKNIGEHIWGLLPIKSLQKICRQLDLPVGQDYGALCKTLSTYLFISQEALEVIYTCELKDSSPTDTWTAARFSQLMQKFGFTVSSDNANFSMIYNNQKFERIQGILAYNEDFLSGY